MNRTISNNGMRDRGSFWLPRSCVGMLILLAWGALPWRGPAQQAVGPPRITNQPQSVIVLTGDAASFSVGVHESSTILSYSWLFLGSVHISNAIYPTLTIPNARPSHVGFYSAVVTNVSGSVTSSPAYLTVVSHLYPQTQFVRPGENATFKVLVDKFQQSGPVEYHWQFNGADLPWQTEPSLTITNVQDSDAGPYAVTVSNPAGAVTTPEAMLVVQKEPPPPRLSCMHWGTNGPGFHIFGTPNVTYVIQASQDFSSWSDISTNTAPEDGKFEFVDPDASNFEWRCYRVLQP